MLPAIRELQAAGAASLRAIAAGINAAEIPTAARAAGARRGSTVLMNMSQPTERRMGAVLLRVSVCLLLTSLPATADVYPVNGVWAAPNANFPVAADESCFAVKLFGVEDQKPLPSTAHQIDQTLTHHSPRGVCLRGKSGFTAT